MQGTRTLCSVVALLAAFAASAQGPIQARAEGGTEAIRAVAKAWSLPSEPIQGTAEGAQISPADLAAAVLLWKNGGPPPVEGWQLRQTERSWESAARKTGVPVDAMLKEYRGMMSDQTREALAGTGEEWLVLAEIRTLERLTGRGARAIAAELARGDFQALLLAAFPAGGPPVNPPKSKASPAQAPANQWQVVDPMAPILGQGAPRNTGDIDGGGPPISR